MNLWADETYDKKWDVKDDNAGLDFGQDEVARNNVIAVEKSVMYK